MERLYGHVRRPSSSASWLARGSDATVDAYLTLSPPHSDVSGRLTATCGKGDMTLCPPAESTSVSPVSASAIKRSELAERVAAVITRKAKVARMSDAAYFRKGRPRE